MNKTILAAFLTFFSSSMAFAYTYQCDDGGILFIDGRNEEGYAQASLTFPNHSSDLAVIWFTSNPKSCVGTMLTDEGTALGPVEISKDGSTLKRGHDRVQCYKIDVNG